MMLCVDGDVFVYKAGFSSQKNIYKVIFKDTGEEFKVTKMKDISILASCTEEDGLIIEEDGILLYDADSSIEVLNRMLDSSVSNTGSEKVKIFLTDSSLQNNFRKEINASYKANRKNLNRPHYYELLRKYLIDECNAIAVSGIEADDAIGMEVYKGYLTGERVISASNDKDLLTVPGIHYNINSYKLVESFDPGELYLIIPESGKKALKGVGFKMFCAQMIMGDSSDNIKGIEGKGPVYAYNILKDLDNIEQMINSVKDEYKKFYGDTWETIFENTADLLWIIREEGKTWRDVL